MAKTRIERINELAHKQKSVGLTEEEKVEQQRLRREYLDAVKANIVSQLDNTYIVEPDGTAHKLGKK